MFLNTYNNSKDYRGIKLNSRFFKNEDEEEKPQEDDNDYNLSAYYDYKSIADPSQVKNLEFGGSYLNYSKLYIMSLILKLNLDFKYSFKFEKTTNCYHF